MAALPSLPSSFIELPSPRPPDTFSFNTRMGDSGSAYYWWMLLSKVHIMLSLAYLAYIFVQVTMQDRTLWFLQGPADSKDGNEDGVGEAGAEEATTARISKLEQAVFGGGRRTSLKNSGVARAAAIKEKVEAEKAAAEAPGPEKHDRAKAASDASGVAEGKTGDIGRPRGGAKTIK